MKNKIYIKVTRRGINIYYFPEKDSFIYKLWSKIDYVHKPIKIWFKYQYEENKSNNM